MKACVDVPNKLARYSNKQISCSSYSIHKDFTILYPYITKAIKKGLVGGIKTNH